jgi:PPOX class probable FMN-dependent enzyme
MPAITNPEALREIYRTPGDLVRRKQLDHIDAHSRRLIELSPFLVMATSGRDGMADATPRGGEPGFVHVPDERTLLIPDRPGNNRLDTLENLVVTPEVGLLFLVPGVDETLRVNGSVEIRDDDELREAFDVDGRLPAIVMRVAVREVYLHCAKALMRSRLWDPEAQIDRSSLPSLGQMLRDQIGNEVTPEPQESMVARYRTQLY